ncbi:MAG: hypothetical protein FJ270_07940 [Planctomycetes bacterium]|nr:hypothetical protein [Planctomycetota bacterium]
MPTVHPSPPAERARRERVHAPSPQRPAAGSHAPSRRPTPEEWRELIDRSARLRLGARRPER